MHFLPENIMEYAREHTSPEITVLKQLNRETHVKVMIPQMLSGHLQGAFLRMISQMVRPKAVLEIGTYTGYSAICLCAGLQEGGVLHTIDINEELEDMQRAYFSKAGLTHCIQLHIGAALDIIPSLQEQFDLVFIDADKINYSNYYHQIFDKVRKNGYIIADNTLWGGKVTRVPKPSDKDTQALQAFNKMVQEDERVENLLLPFNDGLMMVRKMIST